MEPEKLKYIVEAALLAADDPLSRNQLAALFPEEEAPSHKQISEALGELTKDYEPRGIQLKEVASGFRLQIDAWADPWVSRLWRERPPRYSRALLETLALIAYRQPITRGEIEKVRGVSVSSNIMRTLMERDWVRVVGHRDVPGRPALYGTNKAFLDYFGLKSLDDLPTLAEIRDIEADPELDLEGTLRDAAAAAAEAEAGAVNEAAATPSADDPTDDTTQQDEHHGDIATENAAEQAIATQQPEEGAQSQEDGAEEESEVIADEQSESAGEDIKDDRQGPEGDDPGQEPPRAESSAEEETAQAPDSEQDSPAASSAG